MQDNRADIELVDIRSFESKGSGSSVDTQPFMDTGIRHFYLNKIYDCISAGTRVIELPSSSREKTYFILHNNICVILTLKGWSRNR